MTRRSNKLPAKCHDELVRRLEHLNREMLEGLGGNSRSAKARCPAAHNRALLDEVKS